MYYVFLYLFEFLHTNFPRTMETLKIHHTEVFQAGVVSYKIISADESSSEVIGDGNAVLHVIPAPVAIVKHLQDQTAEEYDTVKFECELTKEGVEVGWFR